MRSVGWGKFSVFSLGAGRHAVRYNNKRRSVLCTSIEPVTRVVTTARYFATPGKSTATVRRLPPIYARHALARFNKLLCVFERDVTRGTGDFMMCANKTEPASLHREAGEGGCSRFHCFSYPCFPDFEAVSYLPISYEAAVVERGFFYAIFLDLKKKMRLKLLSAGFFFSGRVL